MPLRDRYTDPLGRDETLTLARGEKVVEISLGWVRSGVDDFQLRAAQLLAPAEESVLAGLHFPRRRESFLLGRGAAKRALQRFLGEADARKISVFSGVFEQPLVQYLGAGSPGVTISHTEGVGAAVAFPAGHPMGIDLERIDADRLEVLMGQMTVSEVEWTRSGAADHLTAATTFWTMKEALAKALTCGLMCPWEVYATKEWEAVGAGVWEARFVNFAQYKAMAWSNGETVMSLALPKKSVFAPSSMLLISENFGPG